MTLFNNIMRGSEANQKSKLKIQESRDSSDIDESSVYNNCALQPQKMVKNNDEDEDDQIEKAIQLSIQKNLKKIQQKKSQHKQKQVVVPEIKPIQEDTNTSRIKTIPNMNIFTKKNPNLTKIQSPPFQLDLSKFSYSQKSAIQKINEQNIQLTLNVHSKNSKPVISRNIIKINLISKQTQVEICSTNVYFPYKPYDLQIKFMQTVIKALDKKQNALLQSPTGTGKTLCLLSSVLSWIQNHPQSQKVNIIYCSRTHSQLQQVQNQLQKTCYRPTMSNFGSRDRFCIKQEFSAMKGRDLMQCCSKAVKLFLKDKRKKSQRFGNRESENSQSNQNHDSDFHHDKQMLSEPQQSQNGQLNWQKQKQVQIKGKKKDKVEKTMCSYFKSEDQYLQILSRNYKNKIITSETLKNQGKIYQFCPYYYSFQIKNEADIIFMPYNYIMDVQRMPAYSQIIKNSIIIFDEAHNVAESACDGRSVQIYSNIFANSDKQLSKLIPGDFGSSQLQKVAYIYSECVQLLIKSYQQISNKMGTLAQIIYNQNSKGKFLKSDEQESQRLYKPAQFRKIMYQWFCPHKFSSQNYYTFTSKQKLQIHLQTVRHLARMTKSTDQLIEGLKQTYDGAFQNMQKLNSFLRKSMQLIENYDAEKSEQWWLQQINHYRLLIKCGMKQKNQLSYEIKLVCLTPSLTFQNIIQYGPRSIIMTSGTLSPLDSWQKQLRVPFQYQLSNKHAINQEQLHLGIVMRSIQNRSQFNFSYNNLKSDTGAYKDLLESIVSFTAQIPNGILVIFPSYRILNLFKNQLEDNINLRADLYRNKSIFFQHKASAADAQEQLKQFKYKAQTKKGAILFCICRGKISEGLDFKDELCRAVIFVGVPYPNVFDPIIKQKREYFDAFAKSFKQKSLTGDEWYTLNTMRAVNQGVGRVIRHINDYGMILLLDSRYSQSKLKNKLPEWSARSTTTYRNFDELSEKIKNFYQKMLLKFPKQYKQQKQEIKAQKKQKNGIQMIMKAAKNKQKYKKKKSIGNFKQYF